MFSQIFTVLEAFVNFEASEMSKSWEINIIKHIFIFLTDSNISIFATLNKLELN